MGWGHGVDLSMDSTSQYLNDIAKRFDNHVVAFSVACAKQKATHLIKSIERPSNLLTLFVRSYKSLSTHTLSGLYCVHVRAYVSS